MKNISTYTKSLFKKDKKIKLNEGLTLTTEYEGNTQEEEIQDDYLADIADNVTDPEDFVKKVVYGITDTTSDLPNPDDKDKIIAWFNKFKETGKVDMFQGSKETNPIRKNNNQHFKLTWLEDRENKEDEDIQGIKELYSNLGELLQNAHVDADTIRIEIKDEANESLSEGKQIFVLKDEMKRAIEGEGTDDERARKCTIIAVDYAKKMASMSESKFNESKSTEIKGPEIKVENVKIKTHWIIEDNIFELIIKDNKSLQELKKLGITFEKPHTWIYKKIGKNDLIAELINAKKGVEKLINGVTAKEFIKFANHNHDGSSFANESLVNEGKYIDSSKIKNALIADLGIDEQAAEQAVSILKTYWSRIYQDGGFDKSAFWVSEIETKCGISPEDLYHTIVDGGLVD